MSKTLNVSDNTHLLIFNKWVELKNKGKNIGIGRVAELAIEKGINQVEGE